MGNNDIALSFDTAEYYSLQEASEYLNRKYKTDSVTPKKLLKKIYEFDLDAYIYGKGFFLLGTHYLDGSDILDSLNEGNEDFEVYANHIDSYLIYCDFFPSVHCEALGLFIRISKRIKGQLLFLNRAEINDKWGDIEGLLAHDKLNADPSNVEKFLRPRNIPRNYNDEDYDFSQIRVSRSCYSPILPKEHIDEFGIEKSLKRINLNVLEHYHFEDYQIESYEGSNHFYNNKDTIVLNLEVKRDEILILHRDLEKLENYIIKYQKPIEKSETEFKRRGVSPKLLKAKLVADVHAQYLWSKDHDKKIRIGEMCELIWNYLIDTEHSKMLPERKSSLKSWISSIPQYASESGRPQS